MTGTSHRVETSRLLLMLLPPPAMRRLIAEAAGNGGGGSGGGGAAGRRLLATRLPLSAVLSIEIAGVETLTAADDGSTAEGSERAAVGLALLHDMLAVAEQLATRHGARLLQPDGTRLLVVPLDFGSAPGAAAEEGEAAAKARLTRQLNILAAVALDLQDNATAWADQRWGATVAVSPCTHLHRLCYACAGIVRESVRRCCAVRLERLLHGNLHRTVPSGGQRDWHGDGAGSRRALLCPG